MIKLFLILTVNLFVVATQAQFTQATLQATGLTCAMCSNAINNALLKVPFVESVNSDIKNSSFDILFKKDKEVDIDDLKDAVEDAGFIVGQLKLTGNFSDMKIDDDQHVKIGKDNFHFVNVKGQVLNGEQAITVVDKSFVTKKQFKKYSSATKMSCIQSGKAASCCVKDGIPATARIYHVTI